MCGDGFCNGNEDCLTCAPDCGVCQGCGDKICDPSLSENCFTCPKDCGNCPDCPTGKCDGTKTCTSCPQDCGVCSVCGNGVCESKGGFETCTNCEADCGKCETIGCFKVVQCALQCIDLMANPPAFSISCVADCVSLGCADVQFFVDGVLNCVIGEVIKNGPGGGIQGALAKCDKQVGACLNATCPP